MNIHNKTLTLLIAGSLLHAPCMHAARGAKAPTQEETAFSILRNQLDDLRVKMIWLQATTDRFATPPTQTSRQKVTGFLKTYLLSQVGAVVAQELMSTVKPVLTKSAGRLFMTEQDRTIATLNARMGRLSMDIAQRDVAIERYKERLRKCQQDSIEHSQLRAGLQLTEKSYFALNERLISLEQQKDTLLKRTS